MTAPRLLKLFALIAIAATVAAVLSWRDTGEAPPYWMLKLSAGAFFAALIVGLAGQDTRPRMMLRFLAALAALIACIALVADLSRQGKDYTSLLGHIGQFSPSVLEAVKVSVSQSLGPFVWDPVLTSILSVPTYILFALFAAACGYASRRRNKLRIFVN